MNSLKIPDLLEGGWRHALILTYGLDALFFENALLSMLGNSCRNRIILADGRRYLDACQGYADNNLVRNMNQLYVAEGIFTHHAAHAKLILLTHPERGRILVGSGNLDLSGYASGGEQFTHYEWSPDEPSALPAFQTAWELIRYLIRTEVISDTARAQLDYLENECRWINNPIPTRWQPVRHNLKESFLSQFTAAIAGRPVEELSVMVPFYDEQAFALQQLLKRLQPSKTRIIIQSGRTSVDPDALQTILDSVPGEKELLAVSNPSGDSPYFHTKLYLAKLADTAVCLQGSPNLSRRAMLWTAEDGQGNIELANLLTSSRGGFDGVFEDLILTPVAFGEPDLGLGYIGGQEAELATAAHYRLLCGEWEEDHLTLRFDGDLPAMTGVLLNIEDRLYPLEVINLTASYVIFKLPETAVAELSHTAASRLQWGDGDEAQQSNPIFVCNRASLSAVLPIPSSTAKPEKFGGLELEDEELELLIGDLESHMVLDGRSIWQLGSRAAPSESTTVDEDAPSLYYEDIDYDKLRAHPKMRQYLELGSFSTQNRSRLQIILQSITDHFQGLVDSALVGKPGTAVRLPVDLEISEAETEEEAEEEEQEQKIRRYSVEKRLRNLFKNFIHRYLRGIQSNDFQEMAGYEIMGHNYIIFSHLLWRLAQKDFFADDQTFIIESMVKTWRYFWGTEHNKGYFASLTPVQQAEIVKWLQDYHGDAYVVASLNWAETMTHQEKVLRRELRDAWHHFLLTGPFVIDTAVIENTWILVSESIPYQPPRPIRIFKSLNLLANFKSDDEFKHLVEARYGKGQASFQPVTVYSEGAGRSIRVKCLILRSSNALENALSAETLLRDWMSNEQLTYYRIVSPNLQQVERLAFYDIQDGRGMFFDNETAEETEIHDIAVQSPVWLTEISRLNLLADQVDADMSFEVETVRRTIVATD